MKKGLVDLNVILDFLARRKNHEQAAQIFAAISSGKIKGFVSAHEMTTLAYFLEKKKKNRASVREILNRLLDLLKVVPV